MPQNLLDKPVGYTQYCSPNLCKRNYLYDNLSFYKIQVNHFMAQDEPFGAKIIPKCILWVRGLVPFWVLRHSFLSLTDCCCCCRLFSHVRLCATPIDGSPPGSPIPGILQARTLQWVAMSFSNAGKWKVKVKSLSRVWLLATPWTAAYQAPPSMRFSRQEYQIGVPLPSP